MPGHRFGRDAPDDLTELSLEQCIALLASDDGDALEWLRATLLQQLGTLVLLMRRDEAGQRPAAADLAIQTATQMIGEAAAVLDATTLAWVGDAIAESGEPMIAVA